MHLNLFAICGEQPGSVDIVQVLCSKIPEFTIRYVWIGVALCFPLALGYNTIGHGIGRDAFLKALAAAGRVTRSGIGPSVQPMHCLDICFETRTDWLPWIALKQGYAGALEGIRQDPRFQSLIEKLDLSQYSPVQ